VSPEGVVADGVGCDLGLDHRKVHTAEFEFVGWAPEAGLDERRGGEAGDVEHAAGPRDPLERPADRRVGHLDHDAHIGTQLAHPKGRLEGQDLVGGGTDDRGGTVEAGFAQPVAEVGAARDVLDAPSLDHPGQAEVGVVVDDHDRHALERSASTVRSPTPPRPQTMTWPPSRQFVQRRSGGWHGTMVPTEVSAHVAAP